MPVKEVSFEWSHHRILSTDSKTRTTLHVHVPIIDSWGEMVKDPTFTVPKAVCDRAQGCWSPGIILCSDLFNLIQGLGWWAHRDMNGLVAVAAVSAVTSIHYWSCVMSTETESKGSILSSWLVTGGLIKDSLIVNLEIYLFLAAVLCHEKENLFCPHSASTCPKASSSECQKFGFWNSLSLPLWHYK